MKKVYLLQHRAYGSSHPTLIRAYADKAKATDLVTMFEPFVTGELLIIEVDYVPSEARDSMRLLGPFIFGMDRATDDEAAPPGAPESAVQENETEQEAT